MREFDWSYVPQIGLVLLTAQEVSENMVIRVADFKDTHALAFVRSGGFIGQSLENGVRLGKPPLQLINGIWYLSEDEKGQEAFPSIQLNQDLLVLKLIP